MFGKKKKYDTPLRVRNPRQAFSNARSDAKHRGILFELTFQQWLKVWRNSGYFEDTRFVMARFGDLGPYALDNIKFITRGENVAEAQRGGPNAKISKAIVLKIRAEYRWYSRTRSGSIALARKYGLKRSHVFDIVERRTWRHI